MIRHLALQFSARSPIHPYAAIRHAVLPPPTRIDMLEQWAPFLHPELSADSDIPLDFPALQDLELDFSPLELNDIEGIVVSGFEV